MSITLAFLTNSEFASNLVGMSGRVHIEAVGKGTAYNSIEDKDTSNLVIYLQDGYPVLIPGMQIDCQANCKVYKSTTKPLLRAKIDIILYDIYGNDIDISTDSSNIIGDLTYQFDEIITTSGNWYQHIDNYYYYIGDNTINAGDTILSEIDATSNNTIVHFIDSSVKFPEFVTSDYSAFGVKVKIKFQAIQNFIPDDNGYKMTNTIRNSQKIFSDFANDRLVYTPLSYFDITVVDGVRTLSIKDVSSLPETVVLPRFDSEGNLITKLDNSFQGCTNVKNVVFPSSYTEIAPYAFAGSKVQSVDLSGTQITRLSNNSFDNCSSLKSIQLPETLEYIDESALRNSSIRSIVLPNGLKFVGTYGVYLTYIVSLYIPESVEFIGSLAFNTTTLKKIEIDENNQYYKDINNMEILTKDGKTFIYFGAGNVDIPEYHIPEGVEEIKDYAFHGARIYDLYIPKSVRTIRYLGNGASFGRFIVDSDNNYYCDDMNVLLCNKSKTIAHMYAGLNTLAIYHIPSTINEIRINCFVTMPYIEELYFGPQANLTQYIAIGANDQLRKLYVDESNPYIKDYNNNAILSKDNKNMFVFVKYYSGDYVVPEGVEHIWNYCFYNIKNTINITMPTTLNRIDDRTIWSNNILSIEFKSTQPPEGSSIYIRPNGKVYVPDSAVDRYKSASNFSSLADRIYPASEKN